MLIEASDPPVWWVDYLACISRETGWSAEFILWDLPYALGMGIMHAAGIFHGSVMRLVEGEEKGVQEMRAEFATLKEKYLSRMD